MRLRSTTRALAYASAALRALLMCILVPGASIPLQASGSLDRARAYFDDARAAHSELQKTPIAKRNLEEYNKLVDKFRRVYLTAPTYGNSTVSLMAIGELSEEMARRWSEEKYFQQAIDAYTFLLREYPQSQFRFDARLAVARIYRYDLKKPDKALEQFEQYLTDYPNSAQSKVARQAAAQLKDELGSTSDPDALAANLVKQGTLSGKPVSDPPVPAKPSPESKTDRTSSPLAAITDVRYWTNPETSRVVIDVSQLDDGQKVAYETGVLSSPPRLYIDLQDTLIPKPAGGRTLEVNGDLLKRVRLAQFDRRVSRLVLDLASESDFQISELTNPYRLVIDVHGKVSEIEAAIPAAPAPPVVAAPTVKAVDAAVVQLASIDKMSRPPLAESRPELSPAKLEPATKPSVESNVSAPEAAVANSPAPERKTVMVSAAVSGNQETKPVGTSPAPASNLSRAVPAAPKETPVVPQPAIVADAAPARDPELRTAVPIRGGTHSLTRALGLKIGRIFIDAGHGGHDTGTIGPSGLTEKEVTLDLAHRIGDLVAEKLGSEVVYSRTDDTFIPLEGRVAMANKAGADLFLSVHLNSSKAKTAAGIETYYLNFTTDPEALKVAARENSGAQETIANLQGIVRKIALQEKLDESKEFAGRMQTSLRKSLLKGMNRKAANKFDRGVKTAPFVVLIGANMPSILTEVSFLSNPAEEKRLRTPEYRQKLAEALFAGLSNYVDSLSGVKVAPRMPGSEPAIPGKKDTSVPAKAESAPPTSPKNVRPTKQEKPESSQPEDVAQLR